MLPLVAINDWWTGRSDECYWVEITDRSVLGANLFAPKLATNGRETFSYALVSHVRPGDVVFHYWKQSGQEPALVGRSIVAGEAGDSSIDWRPHGKSSSNFDESDDREAWLAPLKDYEDLPNPVTLGRARELESDLRKIRDDLSVEVGTTYFPFAFSDKRPLRAAQGYLVKLPAAVVELFEELGSRGSGRRRRRTHDAKLNRAIELRAMEWATEYFRTRGYEVEDVSATKPFDLLITQGKDVRSVEVKGSSGTASTVNLTFNEVENAHMAGTVLVVLDDIAYSKSADGSLRASAGRPRVWWQWTPKEDRLQPTQYRYTLPPDGHLRT